MKIALFHLAIFTALLNFSCSKNVESSPISTDRNVQPTDAPSSAPEKVEAKLIHEEIEKLGRFSNFPEDQHQSVFKFEDFRLKKSIVKRSDGEGSPVVGVIDAVLSKNGKPLARFEGVYHPLGNEISAGFYTFLGGSEKQLLVYEESIHFQHDWIVRLSPKVEIIYNNEDFGIYGGFSLLDIDQDGVWELSAGKDSSMDFIFSRNQQMAVNIILKYDPATGKYLPATHLYPEFVLQGFEKESFAEQIRKFNEREAKFSSSFLQIFMKYVYAGREADAWKFFDETDLDINETWVLGGKIDGKPQAKEHLKKVLSKAPIYKFIKADLGRNKQN